MNCDIQQMVAGFGLLAYLAVILGALLWKLVSPQLKKASKSALAVFLIASGIATVEAQKTIRYVDASAPAGGDGSEERPLNDIQTALDYDYSVVTDKIRVVVAPGSYRPFLIDMSRRDALGGPIKYYVVASTNAGEKVIDGGGVTNLLEVANFASDSPLVKVEGLTFRNAVDGVSHVDMVDCVVSNCSGTAVRDSDLRNATIAECRVAAVRCSARSSTVANCYGASAVESSDLLLCWVTNNTECGVVNSRLKTCLVARNKVGCDGKTRLEGSTVAFNREAGVLGTISAVNTLICNNGGYGEAELNWIPSETSALTNCCVKPLPSSSSALSAANVLAVSAIIPSTYKPMYGSPVIGAGNPDYETMSTDLVGARRLRNGELDIGAFRYGAVLPARYTTTSPVGVPFDWLFNIVARYYSEMPADHPGGYYSVSEMPRDWVLTPCMHIQYQYPSAGGGAPWTFVDCGYISFESLANSLTGKVDPDGHEFTYWEEFLYGTDPFDENDIFTATISYEQGRMKVGWTPDRRPDRVYYLLGKPTLSTDRWECVDDERSTPCRFFKVGVDLP